MQLLRLSALNEGHGHLPPLQAPPKLCRQATHYRGTQVLLPTHATVTTRSVDTVATSFCVRLLFDTQLVLWRETGSQKFPVELRTLADEADAVFLSEASLWEIAIKL